MFRKKKEQVPDDSGPNVEVYSGNSPIEVDGQILSNWMSAADQREFTIFEEMEVLLDEMKRTEPLRVWAFRRDLKWLRKNAAVHGLAWGRQ